MKGIKQSEKHEHITLQGNQNNNKTHKSHKAILLALGCRYCQGRPTQTSS